MGGGGGDAGRWRGESATKSMVKNSCPIPQTTKTWVVGGGWWVLGGGSESVRSR